MRSECAAVFISIRAVEQLIKREERNDNMLKKTLSVVLAVITMFSCFGMLSGTVAFAEKAKTETGLADSINPQVKFFVPETIYLDTSDRKTFKYIYGSDTDGVAVKDEQSYAVYFDGLNCNPEKVTITCMASTADNSEDYTAVDSAQLSSITIGGTSYTGSEAATTGLTATSFPLSTTLDAGVLANAVAAGMHRFIRWQADYVVNGLTYTTYAYSICYSHHSNYAYLRQNSRTYTSNFKSSARVQAEMQVDGLNAGSVSAEQGSRDYAKSSDNNGGTLSRTVSFIVDASRFTNYSKIPYLAARDDIIFHNGGDYTYVTLSASNTSKSVGGGQTKNNGWWSYTSIDLPTDGTRVTFYMRAHSRYNGKDVDNYSYIYINPTNVDKTALQKDYYDAVSAARQRGWYSEGFDEYQNSILAAAIVVGAPSATETDKTINTDVLVYNKYNVKFLNYYGTELKNETVDFGSYAAAPSVSTAPDRYDDNYHYSFTGWDKDVSAPITGDTVFTAKYGATAHDYTELVEVVKDANCTETGRAIYKCICSKTAELDTPIAPDNHDLIHHDAKTATCTATGWYEYDTCSRCDYTTFKVMDMVAHTPGAAVKENIVDAKCEETGSYDEVVYCTECGAEISREAKVIDALGHDLVHHEAKMATCTETGWYEYDTCSRCDYTTFIVMDTVAHTPGEAVKENIVDAKCEETGSYDEVVYCTECGIEISREAKVIDALGHDLVHHDAKMATCTETGWYEYDTCSRCDYTTFKVMEMIDHTSGAAVKENIVDAKCEENGSYDEVVYCTECGIEISREAKVIDALGHDLVHHDAKMATCTETGWYEYDTCSRCDYTTFKVMDMVDHTPGKAIKDNIIIPKCEKEGSYDEVIYCTECGAEISRETKIIGALGHTLSYVEAKAPTCSSVGWNGYNYCVRCDYTEYEEIPVDPDAHNYGEWITDTLPGCFTEGTKHRVCEYNDEHVEYGTIPELGYHSWDGGVVTTEPTCSAEGVMTFTCTQCNETRTESIPVNPNAHNYGEWVDVTPATCLTDGEKRMICEYDESHYISEAIPALGHDIVHHDSKAATCTTDGWKAYDSCSRCDYTTFEKTDKLGHDFSVFVEHKDSDCANKGYDLYKCSRCDETKKVEYALKEHTWDDGVVTKTPTVDNPGEKTYTCKVCGATKVVKLYACSHCDEIFEGDDAYNAHMEEVKKICPHCGYKHNQYFEHMTFIKLRCFLIRLFNLLSGWFKDLGTIAKK